MRSRTPEMVFALPAEPSSPPETPTSPSFHPERPRRHGMHFSHISRTMDDSIQAHGDGHHFSYNRFSQLEELSPRSSSPTSDSSGSGCPPRSLSSARSAGSEPGEVERDSPPPNYTQKANFILEEITDSDLEGMGSGEDVLQPYHYEDAESDTSQTYKNTQDVDPQVISRLRDLGCSDSEVEVDAHLANIIERRARKRRNRRSSGSVKRTIGQSIGSGTDEEDVNTPQLDISETGSCARRLRRKTDATNLIFDDPPPRIDEGEEPESCEEVVEVHDDEEGQCVDRNLPYYVQVHEMDVDSDDNDDDNDNVEL